MASFIQQLRLLLWKNGLSVIRQPVSNLNANCTIGHTHFMVSKKRKKKSKKKKAGCPDLNNNVCIEHGFYGVLWVSDFAQHNICITNVKM